MLNRLLREMDRDEKPINPKVSARLANEAAGDFAALWPTVQVDADSMAHEAMAKLETRARDESKALAKLLEDQRIVIQKELDRRSQGQLGFVFTEVEKDQREQFQADSQHMEKRLGQIQTELLTEPAQIQSLYQVSLRRLEPTGLVYLWPETR